MLFLQHCCISGISLCTALLVYHHSILELWSGLWLGQGNTFIYLSIYSVLDLLLRLRSFSKYIPPYIQTITFDSRILCYTKEFMVSLLHRCCECEISPNHYMSTPVLDSWCEVFMLICYSSSPLWTLPSKTLCNPKPFWYVLFREKSVSPAIPFFPYFSFMYFNS